ATWFIISQHEGTDGQLGLLAPAEPVAQKCIPVAFGNVHGFQRLRPSLLAVIPFCRDFHDGFQLLHVSIPPVFSRRSPPRRSVPTPHHVEAAAVAGRVRTTIIPLFGLSLSP